LTPGEELVITENDQPVARILPAAQSGKQRTLGSMRGTVCKWQRISTRRSMSLLCANKLAILNQC
jgi:antitoxin (DNA-binding transcriptional repressor) of toxin-antitoxin stability system